MFKIIKNFFDVLFNFNFYTKDYETNSNFNETYAERLKLDPLFFVSEKFKNIKFTENQKLIVDSFINKNKVLINTYNYSHITQIQKLLIIWFLKYNPNIKILVLFPNDNLLKDFIFEIKILLKTLDIDFYPQYTTNSINLNKITLSTFNNSKLFLKTTKHKLTSIVSEPEFDVIFMNQCLRSKNIVDVFNCLIRESNPVYFFITEIKQDRQHTNLLDTLNVHNFTHISIPDDTTFEI